MKSYKSQDLISEPKNAQDDQQMKLRLRELQQEIDKLTDCEYTRRLMDVSGYVRNSYRKFCELQDELSRLKKSQQPQKQKQSVTAEIEEVRAANRGMTMQLEVMKKKNKLLAQPPQHATEEQLSNISSLQGRVDQLSKQVNTLSSRNRAYTEAMKQPDMFAQYEQMCRECQGWRRLNAKLAQQLRECIASVNEKTGKDENPNIILINLK